MNFFIFQSVIANYSLIPWLIHIFIILVIMLHMQQNRKPKNTHK